MLLIPSGFTGSSKTPRVVSETRYGQGAGNIGEFPRSLLLIGYKGAASTLGDYEIFDINDQDEAIASCVAGAELSEMIAVASQTPGVYGLLKGCAVPEPTAGTAATATVTFTGTATAGGTIPCWFDEHLCSVDVNVGDTGTSLGDKLEDLVNAIVNGFCTGANVAGTMTATTRHAAARANEHVLWVDKSRLPAGISVAFAGGTAYGNGAVPFTGGVGTDSANLTSILAATVGAKYDYSAWALNEAASIDDIAAQAAIKAGPTGVGPENPVIGFNGTVSAAVTRSQIMNQVLCQTAWMEGRVHPAKLAAAMAALRCVTEAQPNTRYWGNPNHRYNNNQLYGIPPHFKDTQSPQPAITDVALNGGVTPIISRNGIAVVCRSITSRSLNGSNPDYRTLDTGTSMTPQRIREDLDTLWTESHAVENPTVGPDLPNGESPPPGRSTPANWGAEIKGRLIIAEQDGLLIDVEGNPPAVEYNTTLKCLISNVPTVVQPLNHQTGTVIRQIPA